MFYFILSTILFLLGIWIIHWIHFQHHLDLVAEPAPAPPDGPLISVCVPARDEARNIEPCVRALLKQDYPNFEVIVVDDHSTDSTPQILSELVSRDSKLKVIHGAPLPAGWAGKPHALHQAANAASGEWLCCVDADTFAEPGALSACYATALQTEADLFSIITLQVMGTFWEKVVIPPVMTALAVGFSPRKVNDPARAEAIANGQFILIRRRVYNAIGGYERIKDKIVEDKAIAELVKGSGYRLILADGRHLARTRMYTSLGTLWEGWTKNIYLGLSGRASTLWLGAFGAALSVFAAFLLPVWPLLGIAWSQNGGGWLAVSVVAESLILWGYLLYARAWAARAMHLPGRWALTTPLGAAVFAAMMFTSAWRVLTGRGVTWKGRRYSAS